MSFRAPKLRGEESACGSTALKEKQIPRVGQSRGFGTPTLGMTTLNVLSILLVLRAADVLAEVFIQSAGGFIFLPGASRFVAPLIDVAQVEMGFGMIRIGGQGAPITLHGQVQPVRRSEEHTSELQSPMD